MRQIRRVGVVPIGALVLALLAVVPPPSLAGPGGKGPDDRLPPVGSTRQGEGFCFDRPMAAGGIVISAGRCYTFYVIRTDRGAFLGFGPPGPPMIPPGQIVRMSTPAGAKVKGRLFYLVPLPVPVIHIPIGTIRFTAVEVTLLPGHLVITLPRGTADSDRAVGLPFEYR